MVLYPMRERRRPLTFSVRWRSDGDRQVTGELRLPSKAEEPHKVVGSIRVRWKSFTDNFGPLARLVPARGSWDPATTPDDIDIDIDDALAGGTILVKRTSPVDRGSHWELHVHPSHTRWLARIELFPEEIPTPRDPRVS